MLYRRDRITIGDTFNQGGIIAYPTEAVWGLGCDPYNVAAVHRLLEIKNRPVAKGLILITGDVTKVQPLLDPLPREQQQHAQGLWPGHITALVPDILQQIPVYIRGQHNTVAIRVSCHPFLRWFSRNIAPFIVSTSANLSGGWPCRFSWQVYRRLGHQVDYIVPAATQRASRPSQIIRLTSQEVVRSG